MSGLPNLPGFNFKDPTKQRFHLNQTFNYINGYRHPKITYTGTGNSQLEVNSVGYIQHLDALHFDPTLTYGRSRSRVPPLFLPHYALYDKKCLMFKAFFKQGVFESPLEAFRVRHVNIVYFLEDDTITIIEPKTTNSGMSQGRLVKRSKIPKTDRGDYLHWKDLNVGIDVCVFGVVYHTVDCDNFTKEYLRSQGIIIGKSEEAQPDVYTQNQIQQLLPATHKTPTADDKFRRFLEYDGKILKFRALWDDRDSEYGEIRPYDILYFLADDTVAVKEVMEDNEGRDPFPQLLRKTKLPKIWTERPITYPSIYLELSDQEVTEFYQPKDFRIGETIFVLGRRMLLVDCDHFTRNYFRKVLNYEQPNNIDIKMNEKPQYKARMPPHTGIGSLEDSLQSTLRMIPKPPRKNVIKQVTNATKYLRYQMKFDIVHPEDEIRRFILKYNLGDGTCSIFEPPIRNSGIIGGKYLRNTLLIKEGSDPLDPDYYTPVDFYIGALITIHKQRFVIIGADLYVYRYMQQNQDKFPCEVIENMRNYMFNQGLLADDLQDQEDENLEAEKKAQRDAIGRELEKTATDMEKCMEDIKRENEDIERQKRAKLVEEYERSLIHEHNIPPHGIKPLNKECPYPVIIGDVKSTECSDMADYSEFTPKHIDTPEEALQKHYDEILKRHKAVCETGAEPVCDEPEPIGIADYRKRRVPGDIPQPLMVTPVETPKAGCRFKTVKFAEGAERCNIDRYDLCDLKTKKTPHDCTNYYQKCE